DGRGQERGTADAILLQHHHLRECQQLKADEEEHGDGNHFPQLVFQLLPQAAHWHARVAEVTARSAPCVRSSSTVFRTFNSPAEAGPACRSRRCWRKPAYTRSCRTGNN